MVIGRKKEKEKYINSDKEDLKEWNLENVMHGQALKAWH